MIKSPYPCPHPLFDALEKLEQPCSVGVDAYVNNLGLSAAPEEFRLTLEFLKSYMGSADTYTAYRRETERFLHWCWLVARLPLKCISRNEIRNYLSFVEKPPKHWLGSKNVARFTDDENGLRIANPAWRPFVVRLPKSQTKQGKQPDLKCHALSHKSLQALLATLSTYFSFLQQEEYLDSNPVQLLRQKQRYIRREQTARVTRKLSLTQWQFVIETTQQMAARDPFHERSLFMMCAFYLLGLRISELAQTPGRIPTMGDFAPDKDSLWWFTTVGKGNKVRDIAVPDVMLEHLKRYRQHLDLPALPMRGESTPLLPSSRAHHGLGTRQIRNLVQLCFDQAIIRLTQAKQIDEAQDLSAATVHWLRHTAISADIQHRPREHVRDDAGHENASTTEQYIDADRKARHQSAKNKALYPAQVNATENISDK